MKMLKKILKHSFFMLFIISLTLLGYYLTISANPSNPIGNENSNNDTAQNTSSTFDLENFDNLPDALIVTENLSQLPKDLLSNPFLKDILTEDFLFYYEYDEGLLGIRGALRRISYEHNATIAEEILSYIFNTPAEIAFWKGYDGKLKKYMMIVRSTSLIKAVEFSAKIALNDSQFGFFEKRYINGEQIPVYELQYSNRKLYFSPGETYTYIFSDPKLSFPEKSLAQETSFDSKNKVNAFSKLFGLSGNNSKHTILATLRYLSFGYQRFFPALKALRFDYESKNNWTTSALTKKENKTDSFDSTSLWKAIPNDPALCVAVPFDPISLKNILDSILRGYQIDTKDFLRSIQSPAVVCWYPESELYTPLFVVKMKDNNQKQVLRMLFEKSIGTLEYFDSITITLIQIEKNIERLEEKLKNEEDLKKEIESDKKRKLELEKEKMERDIGMLEWGLEDEYLEEELKKLKNSKIKLKRELNKRESGLKRLEMEIKERDKGLNGLERDSFKELEVQLEEINEREIELEIERIKEEINKRELELEIERIEKEIKKPLQIAEHELLNKKTELDKELKDLKSELPDNKADIYSSDRSRATFKIIEKLSRDGIIWNRVVSSKYGIYDASEHKESERMRSNHYFKVCLAYWKEYLIFSPDHRLVENTIAVFNKKYPAVSDSLHRTNLNKSIIIYPKNFCKILKQSTLDSLPESQESIFRESVSRYLFPVMDKFSKYSPISLSMPDFSDDEQAKWEKLEWEKLSSH